MLRSVPRPALALALAGAATLAACSGDLAGPAAPGTPPVLSQGERTGRFLILAAAESLPHDLAAQVQAAGGTLERAYPELGVAVASSAAPGFRALAGRIAGVASVTPDVAAQWASPGKEVALDAAPALPPVRAAVASLADDEPFYGFQWAPAAVHAPEAWNAGYTGRGVRVAILDGGLFADHPDLSANVDRAASRSFIPGFAYDQDVGTFWHGTHVAGIVGAADNGIGVVGIAPGATLIGVKVLHSNVGDFDGIIAGIYYAATPRDRGGAGADVINMSLNLAVDGKTEDEEYRDAVKELEKSVDRATRYAHRQGATLISSAGNDGRNFDEAKGWINVPATASHVIGVSSTAPLGWAYGASDYSRPASYTNYGKSLVDLAAPGGDFAYSGTEFCRVSFSHRQCWVYDMVMSTTRGTSAAGGYDWRTGTSMAAPVVAGIAALVIEAGGGRMAPAQVEAALKRGAVDLGKPGNDEFYGHGWVNAYRSVR
ncbi:MAG: S8 family serine peptidase [Longimicrobiaceae bacterium]